MGVFIQNICGGEFCAFYFFTIDFFQIFAHCPKTLFLVMNYFLLVYVSVCVDVCLSVCLGVFISIISKNAGPILMKFGRMM